MIYFNNAATSFPKPNEVIEAIINYMKTGGFSLGRGSETTHLAGNIIRETRELIAQFFNGTPERVIFTHNVTDALNLTIHGYLKAGDHVIISEMEHNAILRPLYFLEKYNKITKTIIKCTKEGFLNPKDVEKKITDKTRMICLNHVSNVIGTIAPIEEVGKIARKNDITYVVDAAQSAGIIPIDMKKHNIDILGFTGHKSLFGPQGTGGLILREGVEEDLISWKQGGTGIISDEPDQQKLPLPDRFEAGTHNCHGIVGLKAGIEYVKREGINKIRKHELSLLERMLNGLQELEGIKIYGPCDPNKQLATISINIEGFSPEDLGFILDKSFGVITRSGLHCAPLAHKCIGSYPKGGTDRLSLGYFNTIDEVNTVLDILEQILTKPKKSTQIIRKIPKREGKHFSSGMFKKLPVEDCFKREGGTYRFEEIRLNHIEFLKPFGYLEIYDDFPKIFLRIDRPKFFRLKTTIGTKEIVVFLKNEANDIVLKLLENQLAKLGTCTFCGECVEICPQKAISVNNDEFKINDEICNNCLECVRHVCPHIDNSALIDIKKSIQ